MNSKSRKLLIFGAVLLAGGLAFHQLSGWARFEAQINRLSLDLAQPDGLIQTQSLSRLPRDLLAVPLLKDVLTEDFVFYYEQNEDRLSLAGSLRRLAYEHDLQWNDRLLGWVFDEPAEIAFWRDAKGAVAHTLVAISRNNLAKVLQEAATVALKDSQLTQAAEIRVDGDKVPVLALRYGRDRSLLLATRGNRVVILSDPGMLLTDANKTDAAAAAIVAKLLSASESDQRVFAKVFGLPPDGADHRVVLSARYLSFGYQHFFPALDALRFDFGANQWTTAVRLGHDASLSTEATSRALPARPAACSWLPMAWPTPELYAAKVVGAPPLPRFAGTVAACWYGQSALHMPLFVAELASEPDARSDEALGALFAWMVKGHAQTSAAKRKGVSIWQSRAAAPYGPRAEDDKTYYLPTLARAGRLVLFSPDDRLVSQALDTLERRYPSVVDALPADAAGTTLAVFTPAALADLSRQAVFAVLPRSEEPTLHDAAQTHLIPRLKALEKYPAYRLTLAKNTSGGGWQTVDWQPLAAKP
jgi:uncharacterized protein YfaA (DUF2138 family)